MYWPSKLVLYYIRLIIIVREKHSNLFVQFVSYEEIEVL